MCVARLGGDGTHNLTVVSNWSSGMGTRVHGYMCWSLDAQLNGSSKPRRLPCWTAFGWAVGRTTCSGSIALRFMVVISRVISRITIVIAHIRGLKTPFITTHEPPSVAVASHTPETPSSQRNVDGMVVPSPSPETPIPLN